MLHPEKIQFLSQGFLIIIIIDRYVSGISFFFLSSHINLQFLINEFQFFLIIGSFYTFLCMAYDIPFIQIILCSLRNSLWKQNF